MEGIVHKIVNLNGINMHIAEKGKGPVVLFLHGFPELWYTWRHQILAFAALGYRAVAPDLRGFGDTDAPSSITSYTCLNVVGDIVALIGSLGVDQVFLVAHDWGAMVGWYLCLFRPDLIKAFVSLAVPFRPRHPTLKPTEGMLAFFGDEYYMCRFQEPGKMESEIAEYGAAPVIKKILTGRKPGPPILPKQNPFGNLRDIDNIKLPTWFSEEDLKYYASKYNHNGFGGGLNYYRALDLYALISYGMFDNFKVLPLRQQWEVFILSIVGRVRNWELTAAWTGVQIKIPVKLIVGDLDMVYTTPGMKEYVHGGGFKNDVPLLKECVVIQGAGHFINQERAEEVNDHIHDFIKEF